MDDILDFSAFAGSSSSRESSPAPRLPSTPPMDHTFSDAFYQSFLTNLGPVASGKSSDLADGTLPTLLDSPSNSGARLWDFDRYLSSSSAIGSSGFSNMGSPNPLDIPLFSSYAPNSPPLTVVTSSSPSHVGVLSAPFQVNNSTSSSAEPVFGDPQFAIDPMLVAAPSPSAVIYPNGVTPSSMSGRSPSLSAKEGQSPSVSTDRSASIAKTKAEADSRAESVSLEDGDDSDEEGASPVSGAKIASRGRRSASSIIQSGGVSKRVTSAVVAPADGPLDPDDWRPTPEEYKKLSSKEKRQLRNKISARNFRVRRKGMHFFFSSLTMTPMDRLLTLPYRIPFLTEYISTLESHIADRDRLIESIREELGQSRSENNELRQEVETLKRALLDGRSSVEGLGLPPPAPLDANGNAIPAVATSSPAANTRRAAASAQLNKPNTRKDVSATPGSPRSSRAFWGGATPHGGVTPVHATLVPDYNFPLSENTLPSAAYVPPLLGLGMNNSSSISSILSGKKSIGLGSGSAFYREQENLNPLLNQLGNNPPKSLQSNDGNGGKKNGLSRLDGFMDVNPFTIKSVEDSRMHLWAQLAREAGARQQQQQQPVVGQFHQLPATSAATPVSNNLLDGLRPAWHVASHSNNGGDKDKDKSPKSTLAALLSGKSASSSGNTMSPLGLVTRPTSPRGGATSLQDATAGSGIRKSSLSQQPTQQQAFAATLAGSSLLSRLGNAFWDAFSGTTHPHSALSSVSSSNGSGLTNNAKSSWDADKVRKVLEGKAVVRVVDVDKLPLLDEKKTGMVGKSKHDGGLEGLEEKMGKMALRGSGSSAATAASAVANKEATCPVRNRPPIFTNLRG